MVLVPDGGSQGARPLATGEWQERAETFLATRVIVKMKVPESDTAASARATETSLQLQVADLSASVEGARALRVSPTRRVVLDLRAGADVLALAAELNSRDDVEYAEPDLIDRAAIVPNDARYTQQYSPGVVGAEAAWDFETGDTNTVIGIIDSGISMSGGALDHGDLNNSTRIILGTDFVDGGEPRDLNGHGTHVAGIAAAPGNNAVGIAGMNWGSLVYICRTFDANNSGSSADFADAVEEITNWAVANGVKAVINYSGGGGDNQTKKDACQYASDNGMLLVAATGNDNAGPVIFPAGYSTTITGVIAVGATDSSDAVADFSNVGPEVTVVAPGAGVFSTMPTYAVTLAAGLDYGTLDGTSMATPLVSGLCALMWSRHPTFTNQKIKQCLIDTAMPLGAGNFDNSWGFGRVDALAAVKCGDSVVVPTIIGPGCGGVLTTFVGPGCGTVQTVVGPGCGGIRTIVGPSCPQTIVGPRCFKTLIDPGCARLPSKMPVLCPTSRLAPDCASRISCPSWVDACPSALVGCDIPWRPDDVVNPVIRPGVNPGRVEKVRGDATLGRDAEVWYDESGRFWAVLEDPEA